jgi:signal transduction histidine kinase
LNHQEVAMADISQQQIEQTQSNFYSLRQQLDKFVQTTKVQQTVLHRLQTVWQERQPVQFKETTLHKVMAYSMILNALGQHIDQMLSQLESALTSLTSDLVAQEKEQQLLALAKSAEGVNSTLNLPEVLNQVMDMIISLTGAERGFLMLLNEETGELEFKIARNLDRETISGSFFEISHDIVNIVARKGEVVVTTNAQANSCFRAQKEGFSSVLCVPLRVKEKIIGVIYTDSHIQTGIFTEADRDLLIAFASQAARAIDNASLYTHQRRRAAKKETVRQSTRCAVSMPDLNEPAISPQAFSTPTAIMQRVNDVFQVEAGSILLVEDGRLIFRAISRAHTETVKRHTLAMGQGIAGWVAQHGHPLLVPDARADPRWYPDVDTDTEFETKSILCVPMKARDETIGVIEILNPLDGRQFTTDDVQLCESIATLAVIAIENAQLYKELERAYEELKKLDQKKTEFLSTVSHELRTPLTPVQSCIENLLSGIYGPLTAKQKTRLKIALASVREEARLIDNLLDLARIQEDRVTLELENGSMAKIIHDVISVFEYDAHQRKIVLEKKFSDRDSLEILMDVGKVKQVLTNLVGNALKFTPEGGSITVAASNRGHEIEVWVKDTGIGISEKELDRIFDRFYQVDSSLMRQVGGAGIGLNIAKEYVEMHGGRIWVQSEVGKGSTFFFTLSKSNTERD